MKHYIRKNHRLVSWAKCILTNPLTELLLFGRTASGNSLVWVWLNTYCHRTQLNVGVGWGTGSTNYFFLSYLSFDIWNWQKYGNSKFKSCAEKKIAVNCNFGTSGSTSTCCERSDSFTCNCGTQSIYMYIRRSIHLSNCVLIRCMNNTAIHVHFAHKLIMLIFHWCL